MADLMATPTVWVDMRQHVSSEGRNSRMTFCEMTFVQQEGVLSHCETAALQNEAASRIVKTANSLISQIGF